ncbi:TPA: hypothetical protein DCZ39_07745 [Patescibacteria group bacterium]|nr:hypothetical protein [Candidatus Gracilibacteria bacterium]
MHYDVFHQLSTYEKDTINDKERTLEVVNRKNPDRFKDLSGSAYKIYLDGPLGIGLFHDKKPVAIISFSLQNSSTLFIHQIQGITAEHFDRYGRMTHQKTDPIIQTLPRQEGLYDIVTLLAKKYQCKKIILQS